MHIFIEGLEVTFWNWIQAAAFWRCMNTAEADEEADDPGALAAVGCLRAISTILESVSRIPQLFVQIEPTLLPIMRRMLTTDGQGLDHFEIYFSFFLLDDTSFQLILCIFNISFCPILVGWLPCFLIVSLIFLPLFKWLVHTWRSFPHFAFNDYQKAFILWSIEQSWHDNIFIITLGMGLKFLHWFWTLIFIFGNWNSEEIESA